MRHVDLNISFIRPPWMAVFVPASTGISYENQTGGFACLPRQIEGYYVPVFNQLAYESLRSIFEVTLGGSGTYRGVVWEGKMRDDLGEAVAGVRMDSSGWRSDRGPSGPGPISTSRNRRSVGAGHISRRPGRFDLGEL